MKKSLIASLLATGVVLASVGVAGCEENDVGYAAYVSKELVQSNLIVACIERNEQNQQIRKLHRADEYVLGKHLGYRSGFNTGAPYLDFSCGKNDKKTFDFDAYPDGFPQESEYDEICYDCFPELKNR